MIKEEGELTPFYECKFCRGIYQSHANLEGHIRRDHFRKIKCTACNVEMNKKYHRHHMRKAHGLIRAKTGNNDENDSKFGGGVGRRMGKETGESTGEEEVPALCEAVTGEGSSSVADGGDVTYYAGVECQICNQTYSNSMNLKKHVYNVHKMVRVRCRVCNKEVNKKSLDRHMKNVHSAKVSLKKMRKGSDGATVPCRTCGKKCSNLESLQSHMKSAHDEEQQQCGRCDYRGIRKLLEKHIKKDHKDEVHQCGSCHKILKSKSTLKEHMWIHTDHRRFICDICGMRFKRTSNYHGHMKSHQEKKFQCRICGNFFLRKRYLAVHEQTIHNYYGEGVPPQEKGYQCEICGVKLKWKNNLLAHMRIHTGEKPYKCKICGEDFTCHGSLRTHMTKHSICQTGHSESNVLIQQAYLGNNTESTASTGPPANSSASLLE